MSERVDFQPSIDPTDNGAVPASEMAARSQEAKAAPEAPVFRARTFEEAQRLRRGFSEDFAVGVIDDDLRTVDGHQTTIKGYLDKVPAGAAEQETAANPEALAEIHQQTREMIIANLKIAVDPSLGPAERQYLRERKARYLAELQAGEDSGKQYFADSAQGEKTHVSQIEFGGIVIPQPVNGETKQINIMSATENIRGIRPNIRVQNEVSGQFIHWSSDKYAQAKAEGGADETKMTKRIYLNPSPQESVKIFSMLMSAANEAGMTMHGKMLDRAMELVQEGKKARDGEVFDSRADGIVLYGDDDQADELLALVEAVCKDQPEAFAGRPTAKVPIKVGEGIAVGAEPVAEKGTQSLTSHRNDAFYEAGERVRQRLGLSRGKKVPNQLKAQAHQFFTQEFKRVAAERQIDPDNFAFNQSEAA